jgi:ubiquinol-cytochrome c reductase cytochrome c1 subunit
MNKLLAGFAVALSGLLPGFAAQGAEGPEVPYLKLDASNKPSLQRGARDFMNYCSGCHSMKHLRYSRLGKDLDIPEDLLKAKLMFGTASTGDTIRSAMPAAAKDWFGQTPPDLTLETRIRGTDWVYGYLTGFYLDEKRPLGVNNSVLPNASMPHVLWDLQGWQKAVYKETGGRQEFAGLELAQPGKLSKEEYHEFVYDLVNFMSYAAEPVKEQRIKLGFKVFMFLVLLLIVTYLLKKEFWRDVH